MKFTKSPTAITIIVALLSFFVTRLHFIYTADTVAALTGYAVSTGILPFVIGATLGCIGIATINKEKHKEFKSFWWIPLIGGISGLIPLLIFVLAMSQPNH